MKPANEMTIDELRSEVVRLRSIINTPELASFSTEVALEAMHQRELFVSAHDEGK